jgi:hypothetical protein
MIRTPTTFVVGAGASCAYGLPAAAELHSRALQLSANKELWQLLYQAGAGDVNELNAFFADLKECPAPSIDAFLEHRQHLPEYMKIGRFVIAALMGEAMVAARRHQPEIDEDWLAEVIEHMRAGCPTWLDFARSHESLRFVTFNFDTIIEERLRRAVSALYRGAVPPVDVDSTLSRFPVIHVHGQVPPPPTVPLVANDFRGLPDAWIRWVQQAASQLHVVQDEIDPSILAEARGALKQAKVVCFLGFAYASENLSRLDIPNTLGARENGPLPVAFGTAKHVPFGQRKWIESRFPKIDLAIEPFGCRRTLREAFVFRD